MTGKVPTQELLANLNEFITEVEAKLVVAVGDSSLCLISKSGAAPNAVKYNEGKYFALKAAQRLAQPPGELERIGDNLQEQLGKAEMRLSRYQDAGSKNPDWLSYYQGEVDGYRLGLELLET
ncbi:MAG TPA: hypothetical protein PKE64_29450 [Anaerolineae bacterium]|nr:hypothetical protein [Anaerolineae bacterium]HMR68159.1 hypothetical protein [Anaerolineae bacterium]